MLNNAELAVILKEITDNEVVDTVRRSSVLKNLIPTEADRLNARGTYLFAKVASNYAMKWFGEGGIYPIGGTARRVKMSADFKRFAISTELTRDVLEGENKSAIISAIKDAVLDDTMTAMQEINQQLYGNGTGTKAIVASVSGTNVTFRINASDLVPDEANVGNSYGTSLLKVGGIYNFISGDASFDREAGPGVTTRAVGTVLQQASGNTKFTLNSIASGSVGVFSAVPDDTWTITDGDMLVNDGSYNQAINGLDYHIDSGTGMYQGVSRASYPTLRAYTLNADNSALSVTMLYRIIMQAKYVRSKDILDENAVILSSPAQQHAYALLGDISVAGYDGSAPKTNLNAMPDGGTLDYGYASFKFAGLTWIVDVDCPHHKLFIIKPNKFKLLEFKPLSPVLTGENGFAPVPAFDSTGTGAYADKGVYTMTWKGQLVTNDPANAGVKIDNLAVSGLALPTNAFAMS